MKLTKLKNEYSRTGPELGQPNNEEWLRPERGG